MAIRKLDVDAIADNTLTGNKIEGFTAASTGYVIAKTSSGIAWQQMDADPSLGGDLSGTASNAQITANAVTANEIAAGAVGSSEIAAGAVGSSEIATNAVTANEIATGAVGTAEIATGAVTANEIVAGAIGTTQLATNAVTANEVAANSISVTELNVTAGTAGQALTIDGTGTLGFSTVTSDPTMGGDLSGVASNAQIAAGAVGTAEIATDAITNNEIVNGAVTELKIHSSVNLGGPSVGTNSLIRTNSQDVNEDVTISSTTNGLSAGPVEILSGWTVTVDGNWTVI